MWDFIIERSEGGARLYKPNFFAWLWNTRIAHALGFDTYFCFRVVEADGTLLSSYVNYPELTDTD